MTFSVIQKPNGGIIVCIGVTFEVGDRVEWVYGRGYSKGTVTKVLEADEDDPARAEIETLTGRTVTKPLSKIFLSEEE